MNRISFSVRGKPSTQGNKRGIPRKGRDGRIHVAMVEGRTKEANERHKSWRAALSDAAADAMAGRSLLAGAVYLRVWFRRPRPAGHYRKNGALSAAGVAAGPFPTTRPDGLKLMRAVEDALSGVVYRDDSQCIPIPVRVWVEADQWEGVVVEVAEATADDAEREAHRMRCASPEAARTERLSAV